MIYSLLPIDNSFREYFQLAGFILYFKHAWNFLKLIEIVYNCSDFFFFFLNNIEFVSETSLSSSKISLPIVSK